MVSFRPNNKAAELDEYDPQAQVKMSCSLDLANNRGPLSGPLLTKGQYAMVSGADSDGYMPELDVWEVPGYQPAATGWISPRGGPELDSRAR